MDIGCRFYTPVEISDSIATHAGKIELVVDLFSGDGNLYKAFFRKGYAEKALALDINPLFFIKNTFNSKVTNKIVNCLNPNDVKNKIIGNKSKDITIVLNPPFKRITIAQEVVYWKTFNSYDPCAFTQRIECIAIAAAIYSAPKGSAIYVILPEIVLESRQASAFFEVLKTHYSMDLINKYKRARFGSAEVDIAVIMLRKQSNDCVTIFLKRKPYKSSFNVLSDVSKKKVNHSFELFRGKVRGIAERKIQVSVKDLKIGGIIIIGNRTGSEILKRKETNYSIPGDILIARVGQRMLGRIGIISDACVLTNESTFTLRIKNIEIRRFIYDALKSSLFFSWCNRSARGTSNYFIRKRDIEEYVSHLINYRR